MNIILKDISIKFNDNILFDKINLKFEKGKSYAVLGVSGSGKSTILNLISGVVQADEGKVIVDGKELGKINSSWNKFVRKNYINYIFQNFALIDDESIYDNLKIVCSKNQKERMEEVLKKVKLNKDLKTKIYTLSGGEQQRVAIARYYLRNVPITLADEPTGNIDDENGEEVLKLLLDKKEEKITIIVTHDKRIAKQCDEIINIEKLNKNK